ncbi:MAG: hypothetical protein ACRDH2_05715 [Anaerolineales bacterium]
MGYRHILLAAALAFSVTLAVVVGQRPSSEAMAVMLGVVAGVAASIPTSLIVVWLALHAQRTQAPARPAAPPAEPKAEEPRIVVVTVPPATSTPPYPAPHQIPYPALPDFQSGLARAPRQFTVIGGADDTPPQ